MSALAKKVLLIGWDAADWKIINPLLDQGLMPTLDDFINHGVIGNLATLRPILSPMLWNSIATGKRPDKHGILGFMEPDPQTGGVRPVTSTSRKVKAIWNILTQRGYKTHVLGWFAGHPAEPINGISVSDLFPYAVAPLDKPWPLPPGAVYPEKLRDEFAKLRMHPAEVGEAAILPWIPRAAEIDQEKDKGLQSFAKILSENCSIHNAATWILQNEPWDFLAVYYNGIDHFCHGFMHFHPPRMEGIDEARFEIYKDVVNGAYRFHDMMLQTLLDLAGPETTVIIVSDHGFHSDHLRPRGIPMEPAGPAVQHRPFGIVCMKGEHIKQDERIYGATLLDVTPTILTLFGLPVGEDMDGRVLVQAFEETPKIARIPSWENEAGECGMHPADLRMDPAAAQAVLQQFVALGYIQPLSEDQEKAVATAVREQQYNLSRSYMDSRRYTEALPIFEELMQKWPDEARFMQHLAQCYLAMGRRADAKDLLQKLMVLKPKVPPAPQRDGEQPAEHGIVAGEVEAAVPAAVEAEIPRHVGENTGLRDDAAVIGDRTTPDAGSPEAEETGEPKPRPWADLLMGIIQFEEGDMDAALACLLKAEGADPRLPDLHLRIGETYLRQKRTDDADRAFQRALEIDGDSPEAHLGLAVVRLRQRRNEEAAEQALLAVGLQHFLPLGHFYLGVALARLGHRERSALAFETSLSMLPGLIAAHRWLAALYTHPGGDLEKATRHREIFLRMRKQRQGQMTA
ncbi:MAG TPA: alkaline phosphatase family protein [Candidatus Aquilonibacter sp.]|jgi:predicted AlkP superfamily phosphohydrolase/phosphomutase/tetratricopeptide (TPR) repeat protein|nr:alkaline phosphatase family protein [Candidatus Aquilonibacter sp.]